MQAMTNGNRFEVVQQRMAKTPMCVFVDVLLGVNVGKLAEISKSALRPSRNLHNALSVIAKDAKTTSKRNLDKIRLHGVAGDCIRWQITTIGGREDYRVDIYNVAVIEGPKNILSRARTESIDVESAKLAVSNAEQDTIEYNAGVNDVYHYFKNYILETDQQAIKLELWFKVTNRSDNSLVGYGCWEPEIEIAKYRNY